MIENYRVHAVVARQRACTHSTIAVRLGEPRRLAKEAAMSFVPKKRSDIRSGPSYAGGSDKRSDPAGHGRRGAGR